MKVEFWLIGKNKDPWVIEATEHYLGRCSRYCNISLDIIAESRHTKPEGIRKDETDRILAKLQKSPKAYTVLLDEKGKEMGSVQFAKLLSGLQASGQSTVRFIIGGAYGVDAGLRTVVNEILSLSKMTFPHQLVRIVFLEQLYRAFTILRGEGYHHE